MFKLNALQYNKINLDFSNENYSLDSLVANNEFNKLCLEYKNKFKLSKLKTFSFSKEGFLGLFLELKGTIAVSLGECEALIDGAKLYERLGFKIIWIELKKDGKVNLSLKNKNIDFLFLSSYVMDTFVKTNLKEVKALTSAKIISNASSNFSEQSDVIYFDNYKLTGYSLSGVLLFNDKNLFSLLEIGFIDTLAVKYCFQALSNQRFNNNMKELFLERLTSKFKENLYFFVKPEDTLSCSLHFGLKNIKARELIRTLAFNKIFLTNGEGCSLGMSKPSRIIQEMGYDEPTSRNSIHLSFISEFTNEEIDTIVNNIYLKYLQIKSFN